MAVQVKNLRETQRAFQKLGGKPLRAVVDNALKEAAEPVAATTREKLSEKFRSVKANRVRVIALSGRIVVRQTATKTTGKRSDFGRLQMVYGFEPALEEHEGDTERAVERALDVLSRENGF